MIAAFACHDEASFIHATDALQQGQMSNPGMPLFLVGTLTAGKTALVTKERADRAAREAGACYIAV